MPCILAALEQKYDNYPWHILSMHIIDTHSTGDFNREYISSMAEYIATNSPFESVIEKRASLGDLAGATRGECASTLVIRLHLRSLDRKINYTDCIPKMWVLMCTWRLRQTATCSRRWTPLAAGDTTASATLIHHFSYLPCSLSLRSLCAALRCSRLSDSLDDPKSTCEIATP